MVAASLASLALAGSFVEVGKRDIWSPARVAQERPDVRHSLVAVDFLPPLTIYQNLTRLAGMLAAGGQCSQGNVRYLCLPGIIVCKSVPSAVRRCCTAPSGPCRASGAA